MAENMNTMFARISSTYQILLLPQISEERRVEYLSSFGSKIYPHICELGTLAKKIDNYEIEFVHFGSDFMLKLRDL
jgi:hypothetical protein